MITCLNKRVAEQIGEVVGPPDGDVRARDDHVVEEGGDHAQNCRNLTVKHTQDVRGLFQALIHARNTSIF